MLSKSSLIRRPKIRECQLQKQGRFRVNKINFDKPIKCNQNKKIEYGDFLKLWITNQKSQERRNVVLQVSQHRRIATPLEGLSKRGKYSITTIVGLQVRDITETEVLWDAKTHSVDSSVKPELVTLIRKHFEQYENYLNFERPGEIVKYLGQNSDKIDGYLAIIYKVISLKEKYFGDSSQSKLVLQINHDPEIKHEFLKFYIRKNEYEKNFMEKIDRLEEECFVDFKKYGIWILVSSDFKTINDS
jgi:hypothetical protein